MTKLNEYCFILTKSFDSCGYDATFRKTDKFDQFGPFVGDYEKDEFPYSPELDDLIPDDFHESDNGPYNYNTLMGKKAASKLLISLGFEERFWRWDWNIETNFKKMVRVGK